MPKAGIRALFVCFILRVIPSFPSRFADNEYMSSIAPTNSFRRLLLNAVIVPVALMLVIAALLVWQIERLEYASSWVEHSDRVIADVNELQKLMLDLETGMRGYLLAGDPLFLEPYNKALSRIERQAADLHEAILDNPEQQKVLADIDSIRANWLRYAVRQIDRRRLGRDYLTNVRDGEGKAMMDASRDQFRIFISNEESLRNVRSSTARRLSKITLLLTGVMALLVGGVLAFLSRAQFLALTGTYDAALKTVNDLNVTLENRVQERTRELEHRSSQLSEANKELEAFGYSISHDLRAPMRHISGFIDLVRKSGSHFDSQTDELLTTIATTAKLAGRMVDDLLSFSRVGRVPLNLMPAELNPVIDQCLRELAPDIAGRDLEWVIAPLPPVRGDAALLKMILQNLMSNAVKYTSQMAKARIEIGTSQETPPEGEGLDPGMQKMVTLFIRDNGVGFDMQYAQKLFGVFQRLHRAEEFEGTGIGLANVRRIILRHGGRIWAQSQLGQGAIFYFTLPSADASPS
jgi:signal transduction histidine kinase